MKKTVEVSALIDRKAASRLLKVSLRTIDRYRQKGILSTSIIDNKILLNKKDIEELKSRHSRQQKKEYLSIDTDIDTIDTDVDSRQGVKRGNRSRKWGKTRQDKKTTPPETGNSDSIGGRHEHDIDLIEFYKKLYEELSAEVKVMQSKLQGANYRVGQLEAQLRYSIPLIEHKKKTVKLLREKNSLEDSLQIARLQFNKAKNLFMNERFNKRIYLILVLALILLQPLWVYLSLR